MIAARKRFNLSLGRETRREDFPEIEREFPECLDYLNKALKHVEARTDDADAKGRRLVGTLSTSFFADDDEEEPSGRIVYIVKGHEIRVLAAHPDHDEAYKRARARAPRYL